MPIVRKGKLADHPAFSKSLATLKDYGVSVYCDPDTYSPRNEVPAHFILEAVKKATDTIKMKDGE